MSSSSDAVKLWRKNTKIKMVQAMGGKCNICGYNKCMNALEFHHIDMNMKEISFGGARANPVAWNKIANELKKCILLCSNCHREVHDNIIDIPDTYEKFDETFMGYKKTFNDVMDNCPVCGKLKSTKNKHCSRSCAGRRKRKLNWDDYDIFEMSKTLPYTKIGKILGVSDNAVRKHILKNMAPLPGNDPG